MGIGDESLADVSERVLSLGSGFVKVLLEHTVSGEQAEDALEVFGVTTRRKYTCEDLGSGERGVGTIIPDGIGDVEAHDGV